MQMLTQVKRVEMVVRFWNQVKTVSAPLEQLMYVKSEMDAVSATHQYGTPLHTHIRRFA